VQSGAQLCSFQPHKAAPTVVCWSHSTPGLLATASADHDLATWRYGGGKSRPSLEWHVPSAHSKMISALAFGRAESSRLLFSASWDYEVRVWDSAAKSSVPLKALLGHKARISALAVSSSGAQLTSASGDGTIRVWQTAPPYSCECECFDEGQRARSACPCVTCPRPRLPRARERRAAASRLRSLRGRRARALRHRILADRAHTGRVMTAIDAGTALFVSGSEDGCVRLWSLADTK
jgi:WD40 repeat protein